MAGKVGRPRKPVVPKSKKLRLNKSQKQYAKMIRSIDLDLVKKVTALDALSKKMNELATKKASLEGEKTNLEGAKKNLEGILNQIPAPNKWGEFTKNVYEYHFHYYNHGLNCCKGASCPCHHPIYIGPWWGYYNGGSYITYPTQGQLTYTQAGLTNPIDRAWAGGSGGPLGGSVNGVVLNGNINTLEYKTCEALPNEGVSISSGFLSHTSNVSLLGSPTIPSVMSLASSSFTTGAQNGMRINTVAMSAPDEYTREDAKMETTISALQTFGFFDAGVPPSVDAADLSLADLAKSAAE